MNRLVIIGNGFDLAHGLPTGYCDFIDWYWEKVIKDLIINLKRGTAFKDKILEINLEFSKREYYYEQPALNQEISEIASFKTLSDFISKHQTNGDSCSIKFNNKFFEKINRQRSIQNWVDIENEYFKILKGKVTPNSSIKYLGNVQQLNKEFEQVKNLLEEYLNENINSKFDFKSSPEKSIQLIRLFDIQSRKTNLYLKEFTYKDQREVEKNLSQSKLSFDSEKGEQCLFLNFNYTATVDNYCETMNTFSNIYGGCKTIQIHGRLNDNSNRINFGFGDEMDDDYKKIENKDDNEYIRNIKSFQYLQNSNYKDMLDFIESDKFQVYIMGHSCGLSDRILLNKIFEHHHCLSIKVFYHKFDKPKADGREDNFTEIIQNISRHFNKKEMMREKIVNKSLCQSLPQEIRFKEKNNGS